MKTKEKQWLMVRANHNPSFWVLKAVSPEDYLYVSLEVSSDDKFSWFVDWRSCTVFPSGHTARGMKLVHMWATVVSSSKLMSSCPMLPYVALRKKNHFSSPWFWVRRVREKLETSVRRVAAKYWRSWEQFSFLFSLKIENKTSKKKKKKLTTRI